MDGTCALRHWGNGIQSFAALSVGPSILLSFYCITRHERLSRLPTGTLLAAAVKRCLAYRATRRASAVGCRSGSSATAVGDARGCRAYTPVWATPPSSHLQAAHVATLIDFKSSNAAREDIHSASPANAFGGGPESTLYATDLL